MWKGQLLLLAMFDVCLQEPTGEEKSIVQLVLALTCKALLAHIRAFPYRSQGLEAAFWATNDSLNGQSQAVVVTLLLSEPSQHTISLFSGPLEGGGQLRPSHPPMGVTAVHTVKKSNHLSRWEF